MPMPLSIQLHRTAGNRKYIAKEPQSKRKPSARPSTIQPQPSADKNIRRTGSFRGGTRGNAISIAKVFKNAQELAMHALWTVLRTIFQPKIHYIAGFCIYSLNLFWNDTPGPLQKRARCPRPEDSRLARQRSNCSCFAKRPLM